MKKTLSFLNGDAPMTSVRKLRPALRRGVASLAALWLCATAIVAGAHHSGAMYDTSAVAYEGQVVEFQWTNPHSFVLLDVATKEGVKRYSFECSHPRGKWVVLN